MITSKRLVVSQKMAAKLVCQRSSITGRNYGPYLKTGKPFKVIKGQQGDESWGLLPWIDEIVAVKSIHKAE